MESHRLCSIVTAASQIYLSLNLQKLKHFNVQFQLYVKRGQNLLHKPSFSWIYLSWKEPYSNLRLIVGLTAGAHWETFFIWCTCQFYLDSCEFIRIRQMQKNHRTVELRALLQSKCRLAKVGATLAAAIEVCSSFLIIIIQ